MMIAQRLYEGVSWGTEGSVVPHSYMRTDSVRVLTTRWLRCVKPLQRRLAKSSCRRRLRYKSKRRAQEAHEAILPPVWRAFLTRSNNISRKMNTKFTTDLAALCGVTDDAGVFDQTSIDIAGKSGAESLPSALPIGLEVEAS